MPTSRCRASNNSTSTELYSLRGLSKAQLAVLAVTMLQSHLKYFKLSTQGKELFWLIVYTLIRFPLNPGIRCPVNGQPHPH